MCGNGFRFGSVLPEIAGCPSEADAAEGAVVIGFRRSDAEELDEADLLGNIVRRDEGIMCESKKEDGYEDPNNVAEAGRAEPGHKNLETL